MRVRHTVAFRFKEHREDFILLRRSRLPTVFAIEALHCGRRGVGKKGQGQDEHEVPGSCCVRKEGQERVQPFPLPDKARNWLRITPTGNSGRGPYSSAEKDLTHLNCLSR